MQNPVHPLTVAELPVATNAELNADAHGAFRRWRKTHPLVADEAGGYIVLRQADVVRLSSDPRLRSTETGFPQSRGVTAGPLFDIFEHGMLTANENPHERRRLPITRALATQMLSELRLYVRQSAITLVDRMRPEGQAEFVGQFAAQIPVYTLAGLFGVPADEVPEFAQVIQSVGRFFSPSSLPDDVSSSGLAAEKLKAYLEVLLDERRRQETGDFLSAFLREGKNSLTPLESVVQLIQLIVGGTESVRAAITAQVSLLLQHREQWRGICQDASLIPGAVNEAMRFEPGIAGLIRVTAADVDVDGFVLPAGHVVTLSTMSAMRDETVYERPDVFDIRRKEGPESHLIFGGGAHRCVAEALARVELEESLAVLTKAIPEMRLEDIPVFSGHLFIRDVGPMCVSWPK